MPEDWIKYTGSDEQLKELLTTDKKFIVDNQWSIFRTPTNLSLLATEDNLNWLGALLRDTKVNKYLICNPHPYADMIKQWADTGQPVWWKSKTGGGVGLCHEYFPPFAHTNEYEYRLKPFEE